MERYAAYKDSDPILGEIPESWQVLPLKRIAQYESSGIWGNDDPFPNSVAVKVPTTAAISSDGHWLIDKMSTRYLTAQEVDYYNCQDGDIIVVKSSGSATNIISGKAGYIDRDNAGKFSFGNFLLRVRPTAINARLLYYFLISNVTASRIEQMVSTTTYPNIKIPEYVSSLIPIPPIPEQTRIAHYLNRKTAQIDRAIAQKERLIKLLRERQLIVTQQAVTKGLVEGVAMKDSGVAWLGEVPAGWEVLPLKRLVTVSGGGTPSKDRVDYWSGTIPWVSPKEMKRSKIANAALHVSQKAVKETAISIVPEYAVLVVVRGMILAHSFPCSINEVPVIINQDMKALRCDHRLLPQFLQLFFQGAKDKIISLTSESSHGTKKLESDLLLSLNTLVPSLMEQQQIVKYIDYRKSKTTHAITLQTRQIERLREYRRVLIDGAVTGRFRVGGAT